MKMKIYLAGPDVFERDPVAKGVELKALCAKYGAEGLFPLDNEILDTEHGSLDQARKIRSANMALIQACDAVLANMNAFRGPSMDVGTAYEMGVGAALNKIVVGYTNSHKSYVEKVREFCEVNRGADGQLRDQDGMAVEEFKAAEEIESSGLVDNLMIACGIESLCESAEEAIKVSIELFDAKQGKLV